MKTTQKTPTDSCRQSDVMAAALRSAIIFLLALLLCILAAIFAGCRSRAKTITETSQTAATATQTLHRADTFRSVEKAAISSVSTSMGEDREQTHIHIERDPEGRPSDITVNKSATSGRNTATMAAATTDSQLAAIGWESSEAKTESAARTENLRPEKVKEASVAAKILIVAIAFAFFFALAWLNSKKQN